MLASTQIFYSGINKIDRMKFRVKIRRTLKNCSTHLDPVCLILHAGLNQTLKCRVSEGELKYMSRICGLKAKYLNNSII